MRVAQMNIYSNAKKKNVGNCCERSLWWFCAGDYVCVHLDPRRFSWGVSFDHLCNSVQVSMKTNAMGKSKCTPGAQEQTASFVAFLLRLRLLPGEGRFLLGLQKPR